MSDRGDAAAEKGAARWVVRVTMATAIIAVALAGLTFVVLWIQVSDQRLVNFYQAFSGAVRDLYASPETCDDDGLICPRDYCDGWARAPDGAADFSTCVACMATPQCGPSSPLRVRQDAAWFIARYAVEHGYPAALHHAAVPWVGFDDGMDLRGARFDAADLRCASFIDVSVSHASFAHANLDCATFSELQNATDIIYKADTVCPNGRPAGASLNCDLYDRGDDGRCSDVCARRPSLSVVAKSGLVLQATHTTRIHGTDAADGPLAPLSTPQDEEQ